MAAALGVPFRIPSRYVFFALAALSVMMFSIDGTIVAVALPTMMQDLDTSISLIGWTLTAYQLTQTIMMPLAGKLSENFGRTRVFFACVVLFTVGSLLCAVAPNIYFLILFRVIQALGGGGLMPSAVGIIAEEFPDTRPRMIGLFMSIFPVGGIVGPNVGGFIIEHASWRDIFFINMPIGILVIAMLLRRLRAPEAMVRQRLDFLGAGMFAMAIISFLTALTFLGEDVEAMRTPLFWGLVVGSLALIVFFGWHERRAADPVIDPSLVARNPFLAVNVYNFLYGICVWGFFSFIPYYATVQFGMSPIESGAVLTPRSLAMMVTATGSSFLLMRYGYRIPMLAGMGLTVVTLLLLSRGYTALTIAGLSLGSFWLLAGEVALGGVGMGLSGPASNNAALDLVPGRAATVSGIRGLFRSTGGVIGTAAIVVVLSLSPDKAAGLRTIFMVMAVVLLSTAPLVFLIPDTARERRKLEQLAAAGGQPAHVASEAG